MQVHQVPQQIQYEGTGQKHMTNISTGLTWWVKEINMTAYVSPLKFNLTAH